MTLAVLNAGQNYYIRGGSDKYQFDLTDLLSHRGHTVIPFAAENPKNWQTPHSIYFPKGVDFDNPSVKGLLQFIYSKPASRAIRRLLIDRKIDIAHLHIYYGQLTSSILKPLKQAGVPIVQTLHEYKIVCPVYTLLSNGKICQACSQGAFWNATIKRCNRQSFARSALSTVESYVSHSLGAVDQVDRFIAVSDFLRRKVVEMGLPEEKVTTVHNYVDASEIRPNQKPGHYFLYFGRLERLKGLYTLIEAIAPLTETKLLIVGDGEARSDLEQIIESKALQHIQLLGFKQKHELNDLIRNSICTLSPSEWYEPFGLTLVESFAHGRPVIASRIGGIEEILTDGVDGYLTHPGNVGQLREKLLWMSQNATLAAEMGMAGRKKVEEQFSAEAHYQKLMEVYRQVL